MLKGLAIGSVFHQSTTLRAPTNTREMKEGLPSKVQSTSAGWSSFSFHDIWDVKHVGMYYQKAQSAVSAKITGSVDNSSGKPLDFFMLISTLMRDGKTQTNDSWFPKFDQLITTIRHSHTTHKHWALLTDLAPWQPVRGQNQTLFCRTNGLEVALVVLVSPFSAKLKLHHQCTNVPFFGQILRCKDAAAVVWAWDAAKDYRVVWARLLEKWKTMYICTPEN